MSFVRMRRMQKYAWDWSILNANENVKLNGDCDVANCTHTQSLRHIHTSVLRRSNSISPMAEAINVIAIRTLLFGLSTVHLAISGFDVNEIYCDESQRTQLTKAFPPTTTTHTHINIASFHIVDVSSVAGRYYSMIIFRLPDAIQHCPSIAWDFSNSIHRDS